MGSIGGVGPLSVIVYGEDVSSSRKWIEIGPEGHMVWTLWGSGKLGK